MRAQDDRLCKIQSRATNAGNEYCAQANSQFTRRVVLPLSGQEPPVNGALWKRHTLGPVHTQTYRLRPSGASPINTPLFLAVLTDCTVTFATSNTMRAPASHLKARCSHLALLTFLYTYIWLFQAPYLIEFKTDSSLNPDREKRLKTPGCVTVCVFRTRSAEQNNKRILNLIRSHLQHSVFCHRFPRRSGQEDWRHCCLSPFLSLAELANHRGP